MSTQLYNLIYHVLGELFSRNSIALACGLTLAAVVFTNTGANDAVSLLPATRVANVAARRKRARRQTPAEGAASYSRFSSELQDEKGIESQQSACRDAAQRNGQTIAGTFEFSDKAVSGTKLEREGLNSLLAAAGAGMFDTLYFFSLSRLARESVISMPILKRLVYSFGVRVISVTEGVDSQRDGWEMMAQILSMQHERYIVELSANVFRGQEANAKNQADRFSNGDYCFGYTGVPVPGSEQTRRGRHAKPRKTYQIDPVAAEWVRRVFEWFVREQRSLRWITRELNRLGAPKDHRAETKQWHHSYLPKLLGRRKYIGIWPWGQMKNVRDPETGDVSQEARSPEETEKWVRYFPELRLIDDETFEAAQQLLAENRARHAHRHRDDGTFSHDQHGAAQASPSHLLSGLIRCGHCGRVFNVGGAHGKYLFCRGYQLGSCPCQTTLRRDLAERLILEAIGVRILANADWLQAVVSYVRASWCRLQDTLPNDLRDTESALAEVNRKVGRLIDQVEQQDQPDPDLQQRLTERRAERRLLEDKLVGLRRQADQSPQAPTDEWARAQLDRLHEVLAIATPAAAFALRNLVGGQIMVEEVRTEGRKRFFLRGTFQIQVGQVLQALGIEAQPDSGPGGLLTEAITIDFVRQNPLDSKANKAKALWDQGLLQVLIAQAMNCCEAMVTKLLKHWSKTHGIDLPGGHARRAQLAQKTLEPPLFQRIADEVMRRYERGELLKEIAAALDVDINTVTSAIRWWHESRALPVPDGRTRRKGLERKSSTDSQPHQQEPSDHC